MKKTLIVFLACVSFLLGVFNEGPAFEKKVVLGENFGATW